MLDIKFIRDNTDLIKLAASKKKMLVDIDRLIEVDDKRRELMTYIERKKAEQNRVSAEIPQADSSRRNTLISEM
jgi:seryl-tRNA synthetase